MSCLLVACAANPVRRGPMPVRNQHPAQLTVLHLDAQGAATLPPGAVAGRATFAYSSLFLAGSGGNGDFVMDGEILRTSLQARVGLGAGFDLAAELPALHTTGGFLDGFLIAYHDFFGLPDQRDDFPRNQFDVFSDVFVDSQTVTVFEMREQTLALADVPLTLSYCALPPAPGVPGLALRAGIEIPTGDEDHGNGNGEVDFALGVASTLPLDGVAIHASVQHTFAGSPQAARDADFAFADVTAAEAGVEIDVADDVAAVVQLQWETSTLRELDFDRASQDQVLLWAGVRWHLDRDLFLELSLGEDLQTFVSPDITAWLSLAWLPAAGGE